MRQPDPVTATSGPRADRSSSPASVPLRVVAERLSAEEAERDRTGSLSLAGSFAQTVAIAQQTAEWSARTVAPTAHSPAAGTVGLAADGSGAQVASPGLPVIAPLTGRRTGWRRLMDLVSGRRSPGRHRPDELMRSWSMCAPQRRRSRRRVRH